MHALKTYEQTAVFDPTNPHQRIRTVYTALPGGFGSFYWNTVPTDSKELSGLGAFATLPSWAQIALVAGIGGLVGYFGMSKYGDKYIKPNLRKLPVVGGMLSGYRRRRRR